MEKKTIKNTEFHSTFIFSVNFGTKTDLKHQVYIVQLTKSGKMPKLEKVPEAEAAAMFQICQELPVTATICWPDS